MAWLKQPKQKELLEQTGAKPDEKTLQFSSTDARTTIQNVLDQFLTRHSSANDLGLRLHGEQLAAGVRFVRLLKEASYHLVIANPPYQGTGKMESTIYVERHYPLGKADLYAAFLLRGLELVAPGGLSAMLTMRNWMFIMQYSSLRERLLEQYILATLGDFDRGGFEGIPDEVVSVCASIFQWCKPASDQRCQSHCPTPRQDRSRDSARTARKRSATLAQEGVIDFQPANLKSVPEWPLVYWWTREQIVEYSSLPKIGDLFEVRQGLCTGDNTRTLRFEWEVFKSNILVAECEENARLMCLSSARGWLPFIKGGEGRKWMEPMTQVINWQIKGLEILVGAEKGTLSARPQNEPFYLRPGIAIQTLGATFSARMHVYLSIFGDMARSIFGDMQGDCLAQLNSAKSAGVISSLNPTIHFTVGDLKRVPFRESPGSTIVLSNLKSAFELHEESRESSFEFKRPGPSPWRHAQEWAQQAVDRPEGSPLPYYIEVLDLEPPTDHLSFALGVALGRFAPVDDQGQPTTSNQPGILDPTTADLSHALPAGILFLDGSLEENDQRDDLGQAAASPLHQAWSLHGSAIAPNRSLRDWLRLDFFKDVHKGMYENRPIHWPLSSTGKTFVAWVNIHRMNERTLKVLLADHLLPARSRIDGELDDLRQVRASEDRKAAREADSRIGKLSRWREDLQDFITAVEQCADHGAPPTDGRCPAREQDAVYDPDLDDGVMINSAALWPLLEPQWKDPKKWWKELASAQGKKDYDWAHLAMRYWPTRVDEKCQQDPSLAVAHGSFWRYHPERAWAWELRLQQEIGPDFRIEEAPYRPGGRDLGDQGDAPHRQAWLSEHPKQALAAVEKEAIRRMGRGDNRQVVNEMRLLEPGLWSVIPDKVADMEQRLSDRQGQLFSLRAPDETEGRASTGEQSVQVGLALALGGAEGAGA